MQGATTPCDFIECTREELLPSRCKHCNKQFCTTHAGQAEHRCPYLQVPGLRTTVCPVCSTVIRVEEGESLDHAINVHMDTGKCSLKSGGAQTLQQIRRQQQQQQHPNVVVCSLPSCNEVEALPILCGHCNKKFCLKHKMPEHHNCAKLSRVKTGGQALGTASSAASSNATSQQQQQQQKQGLIQSSNTADTAKGIRPDRNISEGDILVLVVYDVEKLKRPNLKPVFFSVAPVTPIGRLVDAAVDQYPALSKTAKYTTFCSVSNQQTGRHLIEDQNVTLGEIYGVAAAVGASWPAVASGKAKTLALCISVEDASSSGGGGMVRSPTETAFAGAQQIPAFCPFLTAEQQKQQQQQQQTQDQSKASKAAAQAAAQHQSNFNRALKPYVDAKNQQIHILVDRMAAASCGCGAGDKKKDDKCCCQ